MDRLIAVLVVAVLATSCADADQAPLEGDEVASVTDAPGGVCDADWRRPLPDTPGVVRITGTIEPSCTVTFREVGRLEGSMDGVAPAIPITKLTDGRFVTATFSPGILAVWDPDGNLLSTFGEGPGQGPGEFSALASIVAMGGDTVAAVSSRGVVNVYSAQGGFQFSLRPQRLPMFGQLEWIPPEGLLGLGRQGTLVRIQGDSVTETEAVLDSTEVMRFASSDGASLWAGDYRSYRITEVLPDGTLRHVIERHAYGFEPSTDDPDGPNLFDLIVGENRLIWVGVGAPDPDPPSAPKPTRYESADEVMAVAAEYLDSHFEIISPTGDLVASIVYDDPQDAPRPISASLWYRIDDDLLRSLILLEPVFTERR